MIESLFRAVLGVFTPTLIIPLATTLKGTLRTDAGSRADRRSRANDTVGTRYLWK